MKQNAEKVLTGIGLLFFGWGVHQTFVIPAPNYEPGHWDWLTKDAETIEYFKFWFRNHGIWTMANGVFFSILAGTSLKYREQWAWYALAYMPVHIILLTTQFFWMFFITVPILLIAIWALLSRREILKQKIEKQENFGWMIFTIIGLAILYYAYDNIFVIPSLDIRDTERGWAWLNTNPEVIDYMKFYFRVFGLRVLSVASLTIITSVTGLRAGSNEAWKVLIVIPVLFGVNIFVFPWLTPILIGLILLSGLALWLSRPKNN